MNITKHRIVVGVDGSPASIAAVQWAVRYAELTGAEVEAVTSWTVPGSNGVGMGTGYDIVKVDWSAVAMDTMDTALAQAMPGGSTSIKRTVTFDHPAAALIAAAQGADLLVVGSRGHGGFTGMLLGSVSAHVVAHAPCPVLVIRHAAAAAEPVGEAEAELSTGPTSEPVLVDAR